MVSNCGPLWGSDYDGARKEHGAAKTAFRVSRSTLKGPVLLLSRILRTTVLWPSVSYRDAGMDSHSSPYI